MATIKKATSRIDSKKIVSQIDGTAIIETFETLEDEASQIPYVLDSDRITALESVCSHLQNQLNMLPIFETQIANLELQLEHVSQTCNRLLIDNLKRKSSDEMVKMLRNTTDYSLYFEMLNHIKHRWMIILTVKDTAGDNMPPFILKNIIDAGFSNFRTDLWRTYVGIIHKNYVICDTFGESENKSYYNYHALDNSLNIEAKSESWRNGDNGDIIINGKNYSLNLRGVNIVVYDTDNKKVIDSVALDSHEGGNIIFKRGGLN